MTAPMTPLAERIAATAPLIDVGSPQDYLRQVRACLIQSVNEDRLACGMAKIMQHVRISKSKQERDAFDLFGGRRNFRRERELADLTTPDDGWLFFAAILCPRDGGLAVLGYNIERVYGPEHDPRWLRFDLNPPGHDNDDRGLRSHFHPANDDIQLPAPIFAPHELIELLLEDVAPNDGRKPRRKG